MRNACLIRLEGVVQGVGFRPFVHRLSQRFGLTGFVLNTSSGIQIHAEGARKNLVAFYQSLVHDVPALARITKTNCVSTKPRGFQSFIIRESSKSGRQTALVSPDISICPDCRKELFDPRNRRYRYPFINCTNCGPRFSIITAVPYDRPRTTMRAFTLCRQCNTEYHDINDRRYHAQPNACAVCGPRVRLLKNKRTVATEDKAITATIDFLRQGAIVAVKGIGGFHIACDAYNAQTVRTLRRKKHRPAKPFALMVGDIAEAKKLCSVSKLEEEILGSPERPIVLLKKKSASPAAELLAPDNNYLGIMLAFSGLHYLLFSGSAVRCLVMTSGNIADEPIELDNASALERLNGICDYFLVHDRDIHNRTDDSIVQVIDDTPVMLRRGRGYAPFPFLLDKKYTPAFACGAELKNTFCLAKNNFAFLSQYIGDLKTYPTYAFYTEAVARQSALFGIKPKLIAYDLHPEYLSTRFAQETASKDKNMHLVPVQHHEAHLASVIAEHRIAGDVIGICFDGIGYGSDNKIWGGEFFVGGLARFIRTAHLEYIPMPGGDKATQEPLRMAISYLYRAFGDDMYALPIDFIRRHKKIIPALVRTAELNPVLTSSAGRLFDAVSALLGICDIITYEAQAAIRLQRLAEQARTGQSYDFTFLAEKTPYIIAGGRVIRQIVADIRKGTPTGTIARKFHNGLAKISLSVCAAIRRETGRTTVCLSGGVFQNKLFTELLTRLLRRNSFIVYYNQLVPTNDGAISLGQVAIANARASKSGDPGCACSRHCCSKKIKKLCA